MSTETAESSTPQRVYVVRYWHKHGDDITVYATEEAAAAGVAEIAREWWDDAVGRVDDFPETPDGLTDREVTELYFGAMDDREGYDITEAPLLT